MSQHTPGPWTVAPVPSNEMWRCFTLTAPSGLEVGQVNLHRPIYGKVGDFSLANARLIAAAPAMLEALRDTTDSLAEWQEQYDPDHTDTVTAKRITTARAILAQVENR